MLIFVRAYLNGKVLEVNSSPSILQVYIPTRLICVRAYLNEKVLEVKSSPSFPCTTLRTKNAFVSLINRVQILGACCHNNLP